MTNALEEMIAQGITKGLEEGRAEGRREGEEAGKRAALLTMLASRFGEVPPALEARIAATTGGSLDTLIARAAIAERIEALE